MDVYLNRLAEAILKHIHNIGFYGEILKLIIFVILISTPDFPYFYYMLGGNLGSLLYGDVSVMFVTSDAKHLIAKANTAEKNGHNRTETRSKTDRNKKSFSI